MEPKWQYLKVETEKTYGVAIKNGQKDYQQSRVCLLRLLNQKEHGGLGFIIWSPWERKRCRDNMDIVALILSSLKREKTWTVLVCVFESRDRERERTWHCAKKFLNSLRQTSANSSFVWAYLRRETIKSDSLDLSDSTKKNIVISKSIF